MLIYATIFGQWISISWTTKHTVDNSNVPSSNAYNKSLWNTLSINTQYFHHTKLQTFRKNCVDWAHLSSNSPTNRTKRVRSIANMSILPITLKLGLCISFSTCMGEKLNGYWTPAFCDGALSNALIKSKLLPPQQIIRGSVEMAPNNCAVNATLLFTTGTSRPQWAIAMVTSSLPSQKLTLKFRRVLVLSNSKEYTFSRSNIAAICLSKRTKQWWRRAWNKHIWSQQGHKILILPNHKKIVGKQQS